jgi:hypothetical protein
MILFTRTVARDFRALFARCVAGRPRGPAPPVVVEVKNGVRTVAATTSDGVTLTHTSLAPEEADDCVVMPSAILAEVEAATDEVVALDRTSKLQGAVKWSGGAGPRRESVELVLPGKQHQIPTPPKLAPVTPKLPTALHECGRTAAKESGRYALSKLQLQGKAGRVVGTDGKVALLWRGFDFPFTESVLVPALPVFGAKPLARITEVRIGRTVTHLVVVVGPWSVWLPTDMKAKYPEVAGVTPRHAPTTVTIDESDAAALLPALPGLPGGDHELRPVTLDADGAVHVRGENVGGVHDVPLVRSSATGPAVRVALDRRVLARALSLGCCTWKLTPNKPVGAEGGDITLLAAQLEPALIAPPSTCASASPSPDPTESPPIPERSDPVKQPEPNGHPAREELPDPLALAEELRDALATAAARAARLVGVLRLSKKEKKALSVVLSGLKQLNLGNGDHR